VGVPDGGSGCSCWDGAPWAATCESRTSWECTPCTAADRALALAWAAVGSRRSGPTGSAGDRPSSCPAVRRYACGAHTSGPAGESIVTPSPMPAASDGAVRRSGSGASRGPRAGRVLSVPERLGLIRLPRFPALHHNGRSGPSVPQGRREHGGSAVPSFTSRSPAGGSSSGRRRLTYE
jgi:hypothetical protein